MPDLRSSAFNSVIVAAGRRGCAPRRGAAPRSSAARLGALLIFGSIACSSSGFSGRFAPAACRARSIRATRLPRPPEPRAISRLRSGDFDRAFVGDLACAAGARAISQHDRRLAGVGGWRHPGIEPRIDRLGQRAEAERRPQCDPRRCRRRRRRARARRAAPARAARTGRACRSVAPAAPGAACAISRARRSRCACQSVCVDGISRH